MIDGSILSNVKLSHAAQRQWDMLVASTPFILKLLGEDHCCVSTEMRATIGPDGTLHLSLYAPDVRDLPLLRWPVAFDAWWLSSEASGLLLH